MTLRTAGGILSEIVAHKAREVEALRPFAQQLEQQAVERKGEHRPFAAQLGRSGHPNIIAEIKKASPSRGLLEANFQPGRIARSYEAGGSACLSVLTDRRYFQGALADLEEARAATTIPALRKDFTIDAVQIWEAAAHGADAVLLIAAVLAEGELRQFRELAEALGLAALVEVHDEEELGRALGSGAELIGVNNRNLETFEVSLETSIRLSRMMPAGVTRVSESGIETRADIQRLRDAGYEAFLVGESLMRSHDRAAALAELLG